MVLIPKQTRLFKSNQWHLLRQERQRRAVLPRINADFCPLKPSGIIPQNIISAIICPLINPHYSSVIHPSRQLQLQGEGQESGTTSYNAAVSLIPGQSCMMLSCCPGYRDVRQLQLELKHSPNSSLGCKGCKHCLVLHSSCAVQLCCEFLNQLHCTGCSFALHRLGCTPPADIGNRFDSVGVYLCTLPVQGRGSVLYRCVHLIKDKLQ